MNTPYERWYLLKRKRARLARQAASAGTGTVWPDATPWVDSSTWVD